MIRRPGEDSQRAAAAKALAELARSIRRPGETFTDALDRARIQRPDLARVAVPVHGENV